jgi:hypothetical protein
MPDFQLAKIKPAHLGEVRPSSEAYIIGDIKKRK